MFSAVGNSTAGAPAMGSTAGSAAGIGADFETFLRMLTAQLKNQDPLNPMEGSDFAVQLATFSGVEQQALTNKLLGELVSRPGGAGLGNYADWIGKEARTTAPVAFADLPLTLDVAPDPRADDVILIVRDISGREIIREAIGPGAGQIDWFGRDITGNKLPDGQYSFTIESLRDGQVIAEDRVGAYARIVEAEFGGSDTVMIFDGGGSATVAQISALRDPG